MRASLPACLPACLPVCLPACLPGVVDAGHGHGQGGGRSISIIPLITPPDPIIGRRLFGDLALAGAASAPQSSVTQFRRLLAQGRVDLLPPATTDDLEEGEGEGAAEEEEEEEGQASSSSSSLLPSPFGEGVLEGAVQDPCGRGGPRVAVCHVGRRVDLGGAQLWGMLLGALRKGVERAHGGRDNVSDYPASIDRFLGTECIRKAHASPSHSITHPQILNTVISVPAWFGRPQRAVVLDAARIARLPTPACIPDGGWVGGQGARRPLPVDTRSVLDECGLILIDLQ